MGESVVLVKNPNYYNAANTKLEKVTYRYIADLGTSLMAYENGEIDGMNSVPSSDYARLKAEDAGVVVSPAYGTVYYDINCAKAPYDNVLVRKALNLAVDRIALIEDVVQTDAEPAYSWISPGYVVDGEDFVDGRSDFELSEEADVEAAQAALAEAGYPKTLKNAAIGEVVTVKKLNGEGAIKRRIMDMGITKGTQLVIRKVAPLGDPIEINVRGYELSLRKEDAEKIEVE
jgi:ABC-type oligopeptide transport system substrate-binding subunit